MGKLVIFGGNGFIGRHLVDKLAKSEPINDIVVFDRFADYQIGFNHPFDQYPNVSIVPGNFFNRNEVAEVLQGADFVFHLISSTNPATSTADPFIDIDTNIRSSVELFELCKENRVKKIIFFSSGGSIYGDIDSMAISELAIPAPRSPYAIGKLTIEHYLQYFKFTHGLEYVIYRVANPYGPGQNIHGKQGVIPIFINKCLHKEPLTVYGDGSMVRDYIYISDLVTLIAGSYNKDNDHPIYNLGSGIGVSVNELIKEIALNAGYTPDRELIEAPKTFVKSSVLSIDRFVSEFELRPTTSLTEGIKKTWDYVKDL